MNDDLIDSESMSVSLLSPNVKGMGQSYSFPVNQSKSDLDELFTTTYHNPINPRYRQ
jgi:hypothetical protein